jgi:hypothetical protein
MKEAEYGLCVLYTCMKIRTMKPADIILRRGKEDDGERWGESN